MYPLQTNTQRSYLLLSALVLSLGTLLSGCTLITDVDRSKIETASVRLPSGPVDAGKPQPSSKPSASATESVSESTATSARGLTTSVKKFFKDHDVLL